MSKTIQTAVEAYLAALTAKERAEQACDEAKSVLVEAYAEAGISESECEGLKVSVSHRERRSFSVEKLRKALSPTLFRRVTKPTVDTRAWDSAVDKGEISPKVIKGAVETTSYVAVLVKPVKGSEKPMTLSESA